ncbi:hypothetical protein ABZ070_27685 [Streptomyces sp. NPDC006283]|uniref:hypothetical protein n=1 Tax=Streptomyces sp. NPDC006283 TaxID=3156741 RepID=UPI0033AD9AF5
MRQLSAPGRTAVWIAASLAVLASAGCMSVSDEEGGKPAPSRSSDRRGTVVDPDGGQVLPGSHGQQAGGGEGTSDDPGTKDGSTSPSPSGSASPGAEPPGAGQQPSTPQPPAPTRGGVSPSAPQPPTQPPPQEPPEPPAQSPTPPPSPSAEPTDPPAASSAPEVHAGAMRVVEPSGPGAEPAASAQVGPERANGRGGQGAHGQGRSEQTVT